MERIYKKGCIIRNQKDPYKFQCVFSQDPEDRREFYVYFNNLDGRQDLMVRCTNNEIYECTVRHEGLSVSDDLYISVSETFLEQNGSFVCQNGGPLLDRFPCFYSGDSVKPEVKYGTTDNGTSTFRTLEDCGTEVVGASLGVVIILLCIIICFLLYKMYKYKRELNKYNYIRARSEYTRSLEMVVECVPMDDNNTIKELSNRLTSDHAEPNDWKGWNI